MEQLPLRLSQATGVPYYRQIVDQVADLVRSGRLGPGALLPSVRELAAQLLVSLITVRNAYDDLENAGLIVRRQGYGTYVSEHVAASSREQTLAEARAVLALAVERVRRLGLDGAAIAAIVAELTVSEGGDDVLQ